MQQQVILLHPGAPPKPVCGTPCNGCGVCCAAEPCPLGQLISRRRKGTCRALRWDEPAARYRCGLVQSPGEFVPWLPARLARRLALRWIASGVGCDADVTVD